MKLSVLDQSAAVSGLGEDAAIRDTLDLAVHAEAERIKAEEAERKAAEKEAERMKGKRGT